MADRIISPEQDSFDEAEIERNLRPLSLNDFTGQEPLKESLQIAIEAAKHRGDALDHCLFAGPPGLGKTTLAGIIAKEMGVQIHITSGPVLDKASDLVGILTSMQENDILFIDEIHRLSRTVEEVLYAAMEDYKLDIMIGKGPGARSVRLDLPKFTVIGATTRTGALAAPLRDRFGHLYRLEFYQPEEISRIITRAASILGTGIDTPSAELLSTRARLTPRIANRLLKRVRDYADVNGDGIIDTAITSKALVLLEIDELGLDAGDRYLLIRMIDMYGTNPVGLTTLAALTGDEASTIEDFYEPYLLQVGLLERTPRGRRATPRAFTHLNKTPIENE